MKTIYIIYTTEREILSLDTSIRKAEVKRDRLSEELFPDTVFLGEYNSDTQSLESNIWENINIIK